MRARQKHQDSELHLRRIELSITLKRSRKSNEPSVRAKSFWRIRRAGLADDRQRQLIEPRAASGAVANRARHPVGNDGSMRSSNVNATALDRREILGASNLWLIKMAAVNER